MQDLSDGRKPDITYPTQWQYKLVGKDAATIRAEVARIIGDRQHTLTDSNRSSSGKYVSLSLETQVISEADRMGIFNALGNSDQIMYVI